MQRAVKKVVLLRVGIDAGCGGIQGPLFKDGTFEFMCIPDRRGVSEHTYGNSVGKYGKSLVSYFPESRRKKKATQHVHVDPEFDTYTYGDPTPPKQSLRTLKPGDVLVFYCGLQECDEDGGWNTGQRPALYLAGFFNVELAGVASGFDESVLQAKFGRNFHVRYPFKQQKEDLVLVKGDPSSRLFRKAHKISVEGRNSAGEVVKVLSPEMQKVFGTFTALNSIERSPPRWVKPAFVDRAVEYLNGLE